MQPDRHPRRKLNKQYLLYFFTGVIFAVWLVLTPPGLLGKADAVGYAVCHRIDKRSFHLEDRQTPLCARCSGMYLGALVALIYQLRLGKKGGTPSLKILIALGIFVIAFGIDGVNSYIQFLPGFRGLYPPHNALRLATGMGLGIGMTSMLLPIFHQTVWKDWNNLPIFSTWRQLAEIIILCIVAGLALYSEVPFLLYPLALLSSATVLIMLAMIFSLVWTMIGKRENSYTSFRQLVPLLIGGFATALLQIAIMDYGRFIITGTWNGFFS